MNGMNPKKNGGTELSRLLGDFGDDDDEDEDEDDDPDAIADPLFRMNMRQYLTEFITEFVRNPFFGNHFAPHLNMLEKKALGNININIE